MISRPVASSRTLTSRLLTSSRVRFDALARTTPTAAAQRIIAGIEKNQPRILIGNDARFMDLLQRFRPGTYWKVLQRQIEKATAKVAGAAAK